MGKVQEILQADPGVNLYLLAFENPDLEQEALALARERYGDANTPGDQLAVERLQAKIAALVETMRREERE